MEVAVLGPLEVRVDGVVVPVSARKERALLAVLATRPGAFVSTDELIDALWGEDPPATAAHALQTYVSALRKLLPDGLIATVPGGYRVDLDAGAVDAVVFGRLVSSARTLAIESPQEAAKLLADGLALWRGEPLADLVDHPFGESRAVRLNELRREAEEDLADLRLAAGEHRQLVAELEAAVGAEPLRERRWGQLMTALYRDGRQADALRTYQRLRTTLSDDLGIEPSPMLQALESAILIQDATLDARTRGPGHSAPASVPPSGMVTFLFTDIQDSSRGWDLDQIAMDDAQSRHDKILREAIARSGGYIFSTTGDGLGAAFARAQDALGAAVAAQRNLSAEQWPGVIQLAVRMGMHTGEAVERDGDYFGPAVIRAARLMSLVDGGRIVCSLATEQLIRPDLGDGLELVPVGTVRLKGLSSPEHVFAVSGPGLAETGVVIRQAALDRNLPRALSRLVGRQAELDEVTELVLRASLVTLTGVGGVGKTRLALSVADAVTEKFRGGLAWVELASLSLGADVVQSVADSVGVSAAPGEPLISRVVAALSDREMLLVLDNCDHVLPATSALAEELGDRCRDLVILATSRERLGPVGERVVPIQPLSFENTEGSAVELLVERIDDRHRALPQADRDLLVQIAQRLDGLPLALELAAARCRALGVGQVAARLGDELRLLADRNRTVERHRTLDAALSWSYELLAEREQRVLQRLSLFAGGFDLAAAEALCAAEGSDRADIDDAVASLVDKSLLVRDDSWLRLLVTTREFAARRLAESPDRINARAAHTSYVVKQVRAIHDGLQGPDEDKWLRILDALWADLRAAVRLAFDNDSADTVTALTTAVAVEAFWRRPEAFNWVTEAVELFGDRPGAHRHELLAAGAIAAWLAVDIPRAIELAERGLAADPEPGTALDCMPENGAIAAYNYAGRFSEAAALARRAAAATAARKDRYNEVFMSASLALSLTIGGIGVEEAASSSSHAITLARALGNPTMLSYAQFTKGASLLGTDPTAAAALLEGARASAASVGNQWLLLSTHGPLAALGVTGGDDALSGLLEAADALYQAGWAPHAWSAMRAAIALFVKLGRYSEAALLFGGCEASEVIGFATDDVPPELEQLTSEQGDPGLKDHRTLGAKLSLAELLRLVTQSNANR